MSETTPVKVSVMEVIYGTCLKAYYKLNSLAEECYSGRYALSETDKSALMDSVSCSLALKVMFEDYLSQAKEAEVEILHLPAAEFTTIIAMAKSVETSFRRMYGSTGIWEH